MVKSGLTFKACQVLNWESFIIDLTSIIASRYSLFNSESEALFIGFNVSLLVSFLITFNTLSLLISNSREIISGSIPE